MPDIRGEKSVSGIGRPVPGLTKTGPSPSIPRMQNGPATSTIHTMADVWEAYRDELEGVEDQVRKNLDSSVTLVNTVAAHILSGGGERIRAPLLLPSPRRCGFRA